MTHLGSHHLPLQYLEIQPLLDAPVVGWPDKSAAALFDVIETPLRGKAAVVSLPMPRGVDGFERILDRVLAALTQVVLSLFPAWLPEARGINGPDGAGLTAVTNIAQSAANKSDLFGPFLVRMARAALKGERAVNVADLSPETVARECAKLVRAAYRVPKAILILSAPIWEHAAKIAALEDCAIWLAQPGRFIVWVVGPSGAHMPRIPPASLDDGEADASAPHIITPAAVKITPLAGKPNPISTAEQRLEAHLSMLSWAAGRAWNVTWEQDVLHNAIRVDLMWREEQCVVEIDGPDHLDPVKFAADRKRDRQLQMAGFTVFRFTNEEVLSDIGQVTSLLEQFLKQTRVSKG